MSFSSGAHDGVFCGRKRLCLAIFGALVLATVVGLITYFTTRDTGTKDCSEVETTTPPTTQPPWGDKSPFTFDDWFTGAVRYNGYSVRWIHGEEAYTRRVNGSLYKYTTDSDVQTLLEDRAVFDEVGSGTYYLTEDMKFILFAYDIKTKWRSSYDAKYKIYDREQKLWIDFPNDNGMRGEQLQICRWSHHHKLAFVYQNNLYYQESPTGGVHAVSTEGSVDNNVFVGHADWLYEEELIYTPEAHWWSPNSRYIVYGIFDESSLRSFSFPWYGMPNDAYGVNINIAYPKPGDLSSDGTKEGKTSSIKLRVYDTETQTDLTTIPPPSELANAEHYVTSVDWVDDSRVMVQWTNRIQKRALYVISNVMTNTSITNLERVEPDGWIDPHPNEVRFMMNGGKCVHVLPNSGFKQIAVLPTASSVQTPTFLTSGQFESNSVVAVDQNTNIIYYYSTGGDRRDRHLYRVGTSDADADKRPVTCMTCDIEACKHVTASFSTTAKTFVLTCDGPDVPWSELRKASDNSIVRVLESNQAYKDAIKDKAMPTVEQKTFPVGGGHTGQAMVFVPPSVNQNSKKTHPLLIHVYAGPGSQMVSSRYSRGWQTYLTSSEGVVYARIDGRGSRSGGDAVRFMLRRKLGTLEIEDQLLGAKWLAENLPYVDPNKVAIWGSSYGGFATLHSLAENTHNTFQCGISIAPVTDFRYYDTAYTERFMDLATTIDNEPGYNDTDVLRKVDKLENKKLLLVHGTADDNVHFLHSAHLMKALNAANIQYDLAVAPDKTHYTLGTRQLYNKYTNFLLNECWDQSRKIN